jgi:hypothetical protein
MTPPISQNSEVIAGMGTPPRQENEKYQIRIEDGRRKWEGISRRDFHLFGWVEDSRPRTSGAGCKGERQ